MIDINNIINLTVQRHVLFDNDHPVSLFIQPEIRQNGSRIRKCFQPFNRIQNVITDLYRCFYIKLQNIIIFYSFQIFLG